jgi:hypothetical protein
MLCRICDAMNVNGAGNHKAFAQDDLCGDCASAANSLLLWQVRAKNPSIIRLLALVQSCLVEQRERKAAPNART